MDNMIHASVRQVSATWYFFALTWNRTHEEALDVGTMQAEPYLSDLGLVGAAVPSLEGARKAVESVKQGRLQNWAPRGYSVNASRTAWASPPSSTWAT
ncbi:hypothetical protein [Deinococcus planocerae]|uniref:hypothetical protein n=1 Tax=Deinococcus planocerae TaxID=1737569 RepID=UPI000C7EF655|nr:hypothetical protein [Deinococcus planocerae]